MDITERLVRQVLSLEHDATRFERFACELVSRDEGAAYLPTSTTWDLGRDGRTDRIDGDVIQGVLAATVRSDLEVKFAEDLERLVATTRFEKVLLCATSTASEKRVNEIELALAPLLPRGSRFRLLLLGELSHLAIRHVDVFQKHYGAELNGLFELAGPSRDFATPSATGLALAGAIAGSDEGVALSDAASHQLVLLSLQRRPTMTGAGICQQVTAMLRLDRGLPAGYFNATIDLMLAEGTVNKLANGRFSLSEAGKGAVAGVLKETSSRLALQREQFVRDLAPLIDATLDSAQADALWLATIEELTLSLLRDGEECVGCISVILSGASAASSTSESREFNAALYQASLSVNNPQLREQILRALQLMLRREGTALHSWLVDATAAYIAMCSLGLERTTAQQAARVLSQYVLIPDTDVLLSLLSPAEHNSEAVNRVFSEWRRLGGGVLLIDPVKAELARHAWNARADFEQLGSAITAPFDEDTAAQLSDNVFVRAFWKEADNRSAAAFHEWMRDYRGRDENDSSRLATLLAQDFGVRSAQLTQGTALDVGLQTLYSEARQFILRIAADESYCQVDDLDFRTVDKIERDSAIVAQLEHLRRQWAETGKQPLLVSSARRLRAAAKRFLSPDLTPASVTLSTLAALLLALPAARIGVETMKALVVHGEASFRVGPVERAAARVLAKLPGVRVPQGKMSTVGRKLREGLWKRAEMGNRRRPEVEKDFVQSKPEEQAPFAVAALRASGVDVSTTTILENVLKENEELRRRVAAIESDARDHR